MSKILIVIGIIGIITFLWLLFRPKQKQLNYQDPVWKPKRSRDLSEDEETFIADYYDEMRYKRKQIQ